MKWSQYEEQRWRGLKADRARDPIKRIAVFECSLSAALSQTSTVEVVSVLNNAISEEATRIAVNRRRSQRENKG